MIGYALPDEHIQVTRQIASHNTWEVLLHMLSIKRAFVALVLVGAGVMLGLSATGSAAPVRALSSTTTHAANVQVDLIPSGWRVNERLKFAGHWSTHCEKLRPNPCGGFKNYGPTEDSISFIPATGDKFVFGTGWAVYKFPDNPNLVSCTRDTWYGSKLKVHNVTVCGHKHAVLVQVHAELYRHP